MAQERAVRSSEKLVTRVNYESPPRPGGTFMKHARSRAKHTSEAQGAGDATVFKHEELRHPSESRGTSLDFSLKVPVHRKECRRGILLCCLHVLEGFQSFRHRQSQIEEMGGKGHWLSL